MNRRTFAIAALTSSALVVIGCNTDQKPSHTATLLNNSGVQDALNAVEEAISGLQNDVDGFDDDNWRDIVPQVKSSTEDIRDAFERLKAELGAVDS